MATKLRAHYDGRVIIPDEPITLPVNRPLTVVVTDANADDGRDSAGARAQAVERLLSRAISGLQISDEALRRDSIYEDR